MKKYDNFLVILSTCTCFGIIGGAWQVGRILAVVLLPWLIVNYGKKGYGYVRNIFKVIAIFYVYMLVSFIWTPDRLAGMKELVYYLVHFILFLELLVFSKAANNPLRSLSRGWMVAVLLCSIVAYWEISTGNHLNISIEHGDTFNTGDLILHRMYASVTFGNYNSYVTFLCFSIPWIMYVIMDSERALVERILAGTSIVMASLAIVINASRGGVLSIIIMLVVYFLFSEKTRFKNIVFVALIGLFFYVLVQYGSSFTEVLSYRTSDQSMLEDDTRIRIWGNALRAFAKSAGFGVGIGGMRAAMEMVSTGGIAAAHNLFLEILLQYGIVIAIVFLVFLWKNFKKSLKVERNRKIVLMMAFISMPVYTIIDSGYLLGVPLYVLLATIYVFANTEHIKSDSKAVNKIA